MSFEIERDERSMSEYPYYGEHDSIIVLFIDVNHGIVIVSNNKNFRVGMFSSSWSLAKHFSTLNLFNKTNILYILVKCTIHKRY
jgi:hypothetical protein